MRWYAANSTPVSASHLQAGQIVAVQFKAWRIVDVDRDDETVIVTAVDATGADDRQYSMRAPARYLWTVLGEHYSVCVKCGDVQPCREQVAADVSSQEARQAERFEISGVCPSCLQPVTARQRSITFEENVATILGPPVTFHLRQKCMSGAIRYDQRWAKHLERAPKLEESLKCDGALYRHRDGVTTCTSVDCPSVRAWHGSWAQCYTRSYGCPRFECEFGAVSS